LPKLQLVGRYGQYGSQDYSPTREWQGGVQLSYPLFTGGSRLAAQERAGAEVRAAESTRAQAELRLESGVDQALAAVRSARARVAALETGVAQAEEVARIEKLALDTGSGVQTDYLTAEAQLLGARASLTEARAAEASARIELARVTGELSREWLSENLRAAESER
ncbi:MAG TPA: TolC family protein, partial [Longimicrobiales bacterium]